MQRITLFSPVNIDGDSPLHICAQTGHIALAERLLSVSGINVNIQNRNDETALFIAAQLDHLGLVRSLIAAKASPHLTDLSGLTPLDMAASQEVLAALQDSVRALKASGPNGSSNASSSRTVHMQKQMSMGTLTSSAALTKSKSYQVSPPSPSPPQGSSVIPTRPSNAPYHDSISLSSSVPSGLGATRERSGSSNFAQRGHHRMLLMDEELHHSISFGGSLANGSSASDGHSNITYGDGISSSLSTPGLYFGDSAHSNNGVMHSGGHGSPSPPRRQDLNDSDRELETVPEDVSDQVDRLSSELSDELRHLFDDNFILDAVSKITNSRSFKWRRTYSRTKIEVLKWLADYVGEEDEAHQPLLRHLKSKYPEAIKLTFKRIPSAKRLTKKEKSQKKLLMVERKIKAYEWELPYDNLSLQEMIGNGSYGSVHRATLVSSGEVVAVKLLASDVAEDDAATFMKEIAILSRLAHNSIVGFVGATITGNLALVMEYCALGNLKQFLQQRQTTSWTVKLRLARQAAEGIAYLHGQFPPIVHRDLKCQNLLVNREGNVKVSDFGLSKTISRTIGNASKMGTLNWLAPEVLRSVEIHNTAVDVYAFGMVLYEILMDGKPPYDAWQALQIVRAIDEGLQPEIPDYCDDEFRELVQWCWKREPSERPSMSQVVQKLSALELAAVDALTVTPHHQHHHTILSFNNNHGSFGGSGGNGAGTASNRKMSLKSSSSSLPTPISSSASAATANMSRIESQPEIGSYGSSSNNHNATLGGGLLTSISPTSHSLLRDSTTPSRSRPSQNHPLDGSLNSSMGSTTSTSSPTPSPRDARDSTPTNSPRITPRSASFQLPLPTGAPSSPTKSSSSIAITAGPTSPKLRKKDSKISFAPSTSPSEHRSSSLTLKSKQK